MIKVEAVWYAKSEDQASEMIAGMVEKYLVGVSYKTKEINDDDEENDDE
jgi:hypothetical protein